jgi:hypothetical protein
VAEELPVVKRGVGFKLMPLRQNVPVEGIQGKETNHESQNEHQGRTGHHW